MDTDLRVGSQIEINETPGRIKAASFEGDGSLLVNAPVGSLAVHSTDTGLPGTNAIVTNEGTPTAAEFKFVILRGDVGATGADATIAVGTTTTGAAGSSASVTNTGSSTAAIFDFTVPKGADGTNYFTLSGSDIYRSTGNVGIGTTSPDKKLHIYTTSSESNSQLFLQSADRYATMQMSDDSGGVMVQNDRGDLRLLTGFDASMGNGSETMRIKDNGNVGIGSDPTEALHIYRDGTDPTYIWAIGNTSRRAGIAFSEDTSSKHAIIEYDGTGSDTGNYLAVYSGVSTWTSKGDGLNFVPANGRVGIGTSNPDGKLHIYESTGTSHGIQVGTLILEHGNSGGSSSIVFPSKVNITSDYAYITYNENYGEAGVSSSENGVLLLGSENDGTGSSDHVRVKTRLVVEADMTSTDPTYAFQVKSSNTTSDLFAVHRGGSIGINGNDSNVPFTIRTNKNISVDGTSYNSYCRWYRGSGNWYIGSDNSTDWNQNLYWFANINASGNPLRKVIMFENDQSKGTNLNANTFTGQHRNIVKGVNPTNIGTRVGLIVSADNNENIKVNGGVERGLDAITINETIPYVSVTTKAYDKQVFGVISGSEDSESREDKFGRVTSTFIKEEGDDRIFINSLGEGAMWISNQNGPLTSGDYVTSSHIPGYGMKQDSEFLANYTVAKITMDCDFQVIPRVKYRIKTERKTVNYYRHEESFLKESDYNKLEPDIQSDYTLEQYDENVNILDEYGQLQWEDSSETEAPYKVRYLLPDGTQISEEEYTTKALANEEVYIAAFVGCTYHCG